MSVTTNITFYTTKQPSIPPRELIRLCMQKLDAEKCFWASRTVGPSNEWALLQSRSGESIPREPIPIPVNLDELGLQYREGTSFFIDPKCKMLDRVYSILESDFDSALLHKFRISSVSLRVGWHDIYDGFDEIKFYARAFVSVNFWGNGTPSDDAAFKQTLFSHPGIIKIKSEIEEVTGPLHALVIYS